jgi:hypothetical protein
VSRIRLPRRGAALLWDAQRFGLTPRGLRLRLRSAPGSPLLCNSLPKAGTHLLERALCLHPEVHRKLLPTITEGNLHRWGDLGHVLDSLRARQVAVAHLPYTGGHAAHLEGRDAVAIMLVRDPRDVAVSTAHYIATQRGHQFHTLFAGLPDVAARVRVALLGSASGGFISMAERLAQFAGWLDAAHLVVRFEELIGARGGGDDVTQRATLTNLFRTAGVADDPATVSAVAARLFSDASPTFRRGAAGAWVDSVSPELNAAFVAEAGPLLDRFGYG